MEGQGAAAARRIPRGLRPPPPQFPGKDLPRNASSREPILLRSLGRAGGSDPRRRPSPVQSSNRWPCELHSAYVRSGGAPRLQACRQYARGSLAQAAREEFVIARRPKADVAIQESRVRATFPGLLRFARNDDGGSTKCSLR